MKRIFFCFILFSLAANALADLKDPVANIMGDLKGYNYVYVIPTSGVTSSSGVYGSVYGVYGGLTNTINPSEVISGYLMKCGYTILPSIASEFTDETLVVSYGYTGRRQASLLVYASGIIIQMSNAKTHQTLASFEAEGSGNEDETDDIYEAINRALSLFSYSVSPRIGITFHKVHKNSFNLFIKNLTPNIVNSVSLHIKYYLEGNLMHEQFENISSRMKSGESKYRCIKRDIPARSMKFQIKVDVVNYQ